jgi:class 3 adenylate cyclase
MERPEIRYAWNGASALAYEVLGEGPMDLVYVQGYVGNLEINWEHPPLASFLQALASSSRLVITDRRGLGLSERFTPTDVPPIETLMEDLAVVFDAAGAERPVLFSVGDCGFFAGPFAATYPNRLAGLILYAASPTWRRTEETPWAPTEEELDASFRWVTDHFGDGEWWRRAHLSLREADEQTMAWYLRYERLSLTPGALYAEARRFGRTDIRAILPSIQVPTLVLHRRDDPEEHLEGSRLIASRTPGARLVELDGHDLLPWVGDWHPIVDEVERFVASIRDEEAALERALATVLFTDIVGSTETAARLGDQGWRALLERHHTTVRNLLARYRGTEVDTAGDGFLATFDGPARGIRCATALVEAVRPLGIEIRAGLHTGEVETIDGKVGGLAVNIGARVCGLAGASEVLVSQTVKDLVAGSGVVFEDRGEHELKGIPDRWRLYAIGQAQPGP